MTYHDPPSRLLPRGHLVFGTVNAFPVACLTLVPLTDLVYIQTSNLMWLHFSEWLLLVGTTLAVVALALRAVQHLMRHLRLSWPVGLLKLVVIATAIVNNLVHTADGWTAVVPWGMTLSIVTVLGMLVAGLLDHRTGELRHV